MLALCFIGDNALVNPGTNCDLFTKKAISRRCYEKENAQKLYVHGAGFSH